MKNLIELFERNPAGKTAGNRICLKIIRKTRKEEITFNQLKNKAREFASWLAREKKIQRGDKIAILGKNRIDWDIAFWGIVLTGVVPVLIDPERKTWDVKKHLLHTGSKILIIADDYQYDNPEIQGLSIVEMTNYEKTSPIQFNKEDVRPEDTAVIVCTSGTTDNPKEVELSHLNLIANIQGSIKLVDIGEKDKLLHILPAHHAFGLTVGKLLPFWVGATNIYTDEYQRIDQLIKNEKATIFMAVPALFKLMAKKIKKLSRPQKIGLKIGWRKLRFCVSGSAPMPLRVLKTFWENGIELREGYGTTENSPVYGFNTNKNKLGSVGKPVSTLSVKIAEDKEILLGGPCIMKGYYKNPEATQKIIEQDENGIRWLHTGDLGYLDKDNCLYINGRKKYVIVLSNGKKVSPEKVELAFSQADYVKNILVVPVSIGEKQEEVGVFVQPDFEAIKAATSHSQEFLKNNPSILKAIIWQDIQEYQEELAPFERISSMNKMEIVADFEQTSNGKIKREAYLTKIPPSR